MVNSADILNASILIVDDLDANVHLLERILHGAGYTSIAFTMNPHKVCELYRKNRYDLILLDIQMPGMDGFQVMECLKESETDDYPPVLVITAEPGHKQRALQAGAKDFVSKPFELVEVLTRVHNMLEARLLQKEIAEHSEDNEHLLRCLPGDQPNKERTTMQQVYQKGTAEAREALDALFEMHPEAMTPLLNIVVEAKVTLNVPLEFAFKEVS